jgi:acyl-CoA thioesterase I
MNNNRYNILIIWIILIAGVFLMLPVFCWAKPPAEENMEPTKEDTIGIIVAFGDSLTAGFEVEEKDSYPAQLQRRLEVEGLKYRVINSGVSGETSSGALSRLNWMLSMKPDIVIVETGANDGLRGVDTALTRRNIGRIVNRLQQEKIVIILVGMQMVANLGHDYTDPFRRVYQDIAAETGVLFMPFFLEGVATNPILNNSDGLHPNRQGYQIIVKNLFPYVVQAIELDRKKK